MSIRRLLALVALALMIVGISLQAAKQPELYQYCILSPLEQPDDGADASPGQQEEGDAQPEKRESALLLLLKALDRQLKDQADVLDTWAVTAYTQGAQLSAEGGQGVSARLEGVYGAAHVYPQPVLLSGRLLYQEEIDEGTPSAVIEERLAIDLFRISDPVGRLFLLGDTRFNVVGVVRSTRSPGERDRYAAFVPLLALDQNRHQTELLAVLLRPKKRAGALSALTQVMGQWQADGTMYSLPKEAYRTMLPLRFLLCFVTAQMIAGIAALVKRASRALVHSAKARLKTQYAVALLPRFTLYALAVGLMYTGLLGAIYILLQEVVAPVYVFPEWVPSVLVEWQEIAQTFWNNLAAQSSLVTAKTPDVLALSFWQRVMTVCCVLAGFLLLKPLAKLRRAASAKGVQKNIKAA